MRVGRWLERGVGGWWVVVVVGEGGWGGIFFPYACFYIIFNFVRLRFMCVCTYRLFYVRACVCSFMYCMCMFLYIRACVCFFMCVYVHVPLYACMCTLLYVRVNVCSIMCVYVYVPLMCVYTFLSARVCVCSCMCVWVRVYTSKNTRVNICDRKIPRK